MKKVVILSAFLTPYRSGAEACAEEVSKRLVADDYDVTIVTARLSRSLPKEDSLNGVRVVRVGLGCGFDKWLYPYLAPGVVKKIVSSFERPQDDTIIIHAILETFAGLALRRCRKVCPNAKRLLTLQTTNRKFLKEKIIRSADKVTAISSVLKNIASNIREDDVPVISNGICADTINAACTGNEKIPGRILFVGRLEKMKGIDTLLRAFTNVASSVREHERPNIYLRIVGDGLQRKKLEKLATQLDILDCIKFVGHVPTPEVYDEFAKAEIFCGLSRSEALGNVFLEAQAAGCAVIGTNIGGIPDIVQDGTTGLLVPPDDIPAAESAIRRLLQDAALKQHLAANGRENARKYDWEEITGQYAQVYEKI